MGKSLSFLLLCTLTTARILILGSVPTGEPVMHIADSPVGLLFPRKERKKFKKQPKKFSRIKNQYSSLDKEIVS